MKTRIWLLASLATACGGGNGGSSDSAFASVTATEGPTSLDTASATAATPTSSSAGSGGATSTGGESTSVASGGTDSSGGGATSGGATSTGTAGTEASTGPLSASSSGEGSGESSGGGPVCSLAEVEDILGYVYTRTINLVDLSILPASYYNSDAEEIVFLSSTGAGRRFTIGGEPLGDVMAPPQALPMLDAAGYDPVAKVAMLLTQGCMLVEADPVTLTATKVTQLDLPKLKINVCSGVAVGVDGDLYLTSWKTNEMVRLTRDGQTVVARVDLLALGLPGPDGISLIAGSENFLVMTHQSQQAAILAPDGTVVVPPGAIGKNVPPLAGGGVTYVDALLTVCSNGHAWVCRDYGTKCHEFTPVGGDLDACACTLPQ